MKKFIKYLFISFVSANIPWIGWGVIFGWPAILSISLILTVLDPTLSDMCKSEVFITTLFTGFVINILNFMGWNFIIHTNVLDLGGVVLAIPSVFVGAILVTIFKPKKPVCICPVHSPGSTIR
jgi:hypothetical protein